MNHERAGVTLQFVEKRALAHNLPLYQCVAPWDFFFSLPKRLSENFGSTRNGEGLTLRLCAARLPLIAKYFRASATEVTVQKGGAMVKRSVEAKSVLLTRTVGTLGGRSH